MSVIISPELIALYAQCPNKVKYSNTLPTPPGLSVHGQIVKTVIQKFHQTIARTGYEPTSRRIIGWIDSECRRLIQGADPQTIYTNAKDTLVCIERWRKNVFPKYAHSGLINIPVELSIDYEVVLKDTVELLILGPGTICLLAFSEGETSPEGLYSSLVVQSKIWAFFMALEHKPSKYIELVITPSKVVDMPLQILPNTLSRSSGVFKQIMRGLKDKVYYPVKNSQCRDCVFRDRCSY